MLVAGVLQFYALAIVGESVLELVARVFYANHNSLTPMYVAIAGMVLRIGLMVFWRDTLGAQGLALAYAVGVSFEAFALWVLAQRKYVRAEPGGGTRA
jgi:putative peptidoglycan lipid II flippase